MRVGTCEEVSVGRGGWSGRGPGPLDRRAPRGHQTPAAVRAARLAPAQPAPLPAAAWGARLRLTTVDRYTPKEHGPRLAPRPTLLNGSAAGSSAEPTWPASSLTLRRSLGWSGRSRSNRIPLEQNDGWAVARRYVTPETVRPGADTELPSLPAVVG